MSAMKYFKVHFDNNVPSSVERLFDMANEDIIRNRFQVYRRETEPVAEHYKRQGKFEPIKGVGSIDHIFDAISNSIEAEMTTREEA